MPRAFLQSTQLRRAVLNTGSRTAALAGSGHGAGGAAGVSRRHFATQALHHSSGASRLFGRQTKHGGLAVAVAGSVSLAVLSQLESVSVEDLLPALGNIEPPSRNRIEDFYAFQTTDTLGRGQFGTVSTAVDKSTGEVVAVKRVSRENASEDHVREETEAHREVGSHPNVVGLKEVFTDDDCWYIVMELAAGGELYDRLTTEGVLLQESDVCSLVRETADALAFMHDRGIVHGDIKPENMLLASTSSGGAVVSASEDVSLGSDAGGLGSAQGEADEQDGGALGRVLLADFGSSFRVRGSSGGGRRVTKAYTAAYSAPEVVTNSSAVDQKADVWSLGVIAYVMVKGHHPFDPTSEATDEEVMHNIINSEPDWEGLEPQAERLIRQMLSRDPADRPSAREVLQNPWLRSTQQ